MRAKYFGFILAIPLMVILFIKVIPSLSSKFPGTKNSAESTDTAQAQVQDSRAPKIVINQIGYYPEWPKSAFLLNASDNRVQQAEMIDCNTNKPVFSFQVGKPIKDAASTDAIATLNFTEFRQPGCYYLKVGDIKSYYLQIGNNIYNEPLTKLLHSYYLQRCGVAIDDPVTKIRHAACHVNDGTMAHDDAVHRAGDRLFAPGGWHDAGDYGKYLATTTVTVGRLLSLYLQAPSLFTDNQLAIPESGNGVPDLLDEVKVGLDWMLTMQRADGAIYRKLSGKEWPFNKTPDADKQERFVYGISTPETAKFAAAMGMAARVYAKYPEVSQNYLNAAQKAWAVLQKTPEMTVEEVQGDDSGSGKYLTSEVDTEETLKTERDDRLWAAAELWITTRQPNFKTYFAQNVDACPYTLFEWKNVCPLGLVDYLFNPGQEAEGDLKQKIKAKIIQRADELLKNVEGSGYRIANPRFIWGSNKMTAEDGITLLYANKLTGNPAYWNAALDQVSYLLGRNHFNKSFVTGVGSNPVQHVNHLYARAAKVDIPGLLVGGPNNGAEDNIAPKNLGPLSYLDDEQSYATNEYAIDYNAALSALIGMLLKVP